MRWMTPLGFAVCTGSLALGCASSAGPGPSTAAASDSGGALRVSDMPPQNVRLVEGQLEVWGRTEVPAGSRLQAAQALVDSATRAEFIKFVSVRVESLEVDFATAAGDFVSVKITEAAASLVPPSAPVERGWEQREGKIYLVGRLRIEPAAFAEALADALPETTESERASIVAKVYR